MSIPETGQVLRVNTSIVQVFLGGNEYEESETITPSGADLVIKKGQLIGRIAADQKVTVLASAAADGSQFVLGVARNDYTILDGESKKIWYCVAGKVSTHAIVFDGSDDFNTIVDDRILRDRIKSDTAGITLLGSVENTVLQPTS